MLGDPPRCATHGAVLTSGGTCLLCIKRLGDPSAPPTRNVLPWTTAFVVGGLVVLAVVFKVYLSVSDKHPAQAATGDPAPAYGPPPLPTTVTTPTSRIPGNDRASLLADARKEVVIDFYGASWCGYCSRAKAYLDREGIPYQYYDVDLPSNKTKVRQLNARGTVPTMKIDDQVLVGYSEPALKRALDRAAESRVARR